MVANGVFEALGEPRRRAILGLLADGERSAGEVLEGLQALGAGAGAAVSQPTVSQHLKVLREVGLVTMRADGTRRLYSIDPAGVAAARSWLDALAGPPDPFAQPLDALATEVARGRRARSGARSGSGQARRNRSA